MILTQQFRYLLSVIKSTRNKFTLVAGIVFVLGVLAYLPVPLPHRTQEEIIGKFAVMTGISFFLIRNIWLRLFLLYCIGQVFVYFSKASYLTLQTLFFYVVLMQVLADNLNKERAGKLLDIICLVGVLQAGWMILQYNGVWWLILNDIATYKINIVGFTSNPNLGSGLLAICVPAFLRKRMVFFLPFILTALWFNHNLQGLLVTAIILTVFIVHRLKNKIPFIVCSVLGVGLWLWRSGEWLTFTRYDRLPIWKFCVLKEIPYHFWCGLGLGHGDKIWKDIMKFCHVTEAFTHPHNEFIFLAIELGVVGFVLFMVYLLTSLWRFIRSMDKQKYLVFLGLVSVFLISGVSFIFHVTVGILAIIYFSIMMYENGDSRCINI